MKIDCDNKIRETIYCGGGTDNWKWLVESPKIIHKENR